MTDHDASDQHPGTNTAQRIVDASMTMFALRGFHGSGIRDIAREANLSTATLYHYMGTKEDLLLRIMREANTRLVSAAQKALADTHDPAAQITYLARILVTIEATHRVTVVGDTELRVLNPESAAEIVAIRDSFEQLWSTALTAGIDEGCFTVEDLHLSRYALIQMCTGVAHWFTPEGRLNLEQVTTKYGNMALNLLQAQRGGVALSASSMGLHRAQVEIDIAMQEFETFISPRARPTHFAMVRKPLSVPVDNLESERTPRVRSGHPDAVPKAINQITSPMSKS